MLKTLISTAAIAATLATPIAAKPTTCEELVYASATGVAMAVEGSSAIEIYKKYKDEGFNLQQIEYMADLMPEMVKLMVAGYDVVDVLDFAVDACEAANG